MVGGTANFLRSCLHAMVWGLLDFDFQLPHTKSEHFSAQFQPEESIDESSHQSEQKRCSFEARLEVFHKFSSASADRQ